MSTAELCNHPFLNNGYQYMLLNSSTLMLFFYFALVVIPAMTRSDAGTENGLLATCQMFLRRNCTDGLAGSNSHVYGTSMRNQVHAVLLVFNRYCKCTIIGIYVHVANIMTD